MMTINTTIHPKPKNYCELAEPGEGYRLLKPGEIILDSDEVWWACSSREEPRWLRNTSKTGQFLLPDWRPRRRKVMPTIQELYNELLRAVASKYPWETRHETILRYIKEREASIILCRGSAVS